MKEQDINHTPGPWSVSEDGDVLDQDGYEIAEVSTTYSILNNWSSLGISHWSDAPGKAFIERSDQEKIANAHLIATAPDLLAVLHAVTPMLFDEEDECVFCRAEPYPSDNDKNEPVYYHDENCPAELIRVTIAKAQGLNQ